MYYDCNPTYIHYLKTDRPTNQWEGEGNQRVEQTGRPADWPPRCNCSVAICHLLQA